MKLCWSGGVGGGETGGVAIGAGDGVERVDGIFVGELGSVNFVDEGQSDGERRRGRRAER